MVTEATHVCGNDHEEGAHDPRRDLTPRDDVFATFEDDADTRFMYVPGEILVATADVVCVRAVLEEGGCTVLEVDDVLGLQKWQTPRADAVRYLVDQCRSICSRCLPVVSANVVCGLGGSRHTQWGCASAPEPATAASTLYLTETEVGSGAGGGVRIGLIDTGVAAKPEWVAERCERPNGQLDVEVPSLARAKNLDPGAGHGTFAAGLIIRRVPGATLVAPRKVAGGLIDDWALAHALLEIGTENVHLVHLALGGFTPHNCGLPATERALQSLAKTNPDLVVIASAGNDSVDREHYPAAYKDVVAVGALDKGSDHVASFSNRGRWVDACIRGEDVVSTFFDEELVPHLAATEEPQPFEGWASWSGASWAAAQVTGAIAARMSPGDPSKRISAREAVFHLVTDAGPDKRVPGLGTRID